MFRAARCQVDFSLYIHDTFAATVKKHDIWDLVYEETERVILVSPGVHRTRDNRKEDGHANKWMGCSTVDFPRMPQGWRQGLRFHGMDQRDPIPLFGIMDVNPEIQDDESLLIRLPKAHLLPWIMPLRAGCWTQEDLLAYCSQRMEAALSTGISVEAALREIKMPIVYKSRMETDTWKKFVTRYVPGAFSSASSRSATAGLSHIGA